MAPPSDDITSFTDGLTCAGGVVGGPPAVLSTSTCSFGNKIRQTARAGARCALTDSIDLSAAFGHGDFSAFGRFPSRAAGHGEQRAGGDGYQ